MGLFLLDAYTHLHQGWSVAKTTIMALGTIALVAAAIPLLRVYLLRRILVLPAGVLRRHYLNNPSYFTANATIGWIKILDSTIKRWNSTANVPQTMRNAQALLQSSYWLNLTVYAALLAVDDESTFRWIKSRLRWQARAYALRSRYYQWRPGK